MTHQVIANIHNVIFLPDIFGSFRITLSKRLHCSLKYPSSLLAQVEDATQDRRLGYPNVISRPANGSIRYAYWIQRTTAQGSHTQNDLGNTGSAIACAFEVTCNGESRSKVT